MTLRWHSLATFLVCTTCGGCFASLVDGRTDDAPAAPGAPEVDAGSDLPLAGDAAGPACVPAPEPGPEIVFLPVGVGGDCVAETFATPVNVTLTGATAEGGTLRLDLLTSLARDRDYRCAIVLVGVGDDAGTVAANLDASGFVLLQVSDGALSMRRNDIFCEMPCDLPLALWAGSLRLPATAPLPQNEWLTLRPGAEECAAFSRCTQRRFAVVAEAGGLALPTSPGETQNGVMPEPVAGANRLLVHVYSTGTDCGPADGDAIPLATALVHHWRDLDNP